MIALGQALSQQGVRAKDDPLVMLSALMTSPRRNKASKETTHATQATSTRASGHAAGVLAASLAFTGCSGSSGGGGDKVTLRFIWWGNDTRNQLTQKVIDAYVAKHPNIKIEVETSDFASYWQKLSTQFAGGDAPDVIQMDEKYISEYATQGALADLGELGIDTSNFADGTVEPGKIDGKLYGATMAINAPVFLANKAVFDKAGVKVPNDKTWTWDDFTKLAKDVQAKGNGEYFGTENLIGIDGATKIWIRQNGGQQFTADGIGFDETQITPWFQYWKDLTGTGTAPATATIENQTTGVDQSLLGTNKLAIGYQWSNQVNAVQKATGSDILLLRPPTKSGKADDAQLWYKSSMYLSASAKSKHPKEAAEFMNYLLNDPEAGAILGTERGIPVNTKVRDAITPSLDEVNKKVVDFMKSIESEISPGGAVPLPGGGQSETIQRRASDQVLLGTLDPAAAAKQYVTELKAAMKLS